MVGDVVADLFVRLARKVRLTLGAGHGTGHLFFAQLKVELVAGAAGTNDPDFL
jgi:hypothetical protein